MTATEKVALVLYGYFLWVSLPARKDFTIIRLAVSMTLAISAAAWFCFGGGK